jgi:hypothetical protein
MGKIQKGKGLSTLIETRLSAEADIYNQLKKFVCLLLMIWQLKKNWSTVVQTISFTEHYKGTLRKKTCLS